MGDSRARIADAKGLYSEPRPPIILITNSVFKTGDPTVANSSLMDLMSRRYSTTERFAFETFLN